MKLISEHKIKRQDLRKPGLLMRAMVLTLAFCLLPLALAAAQSGRQPGQSKPSPPPAQETRPRRVDDDQDEIKLSANLITAITSVTDPAGNQVNDLTQQ